MSKSKICSWTTIFGPGGPGKLWNVSALGSGCLSIKITAFLTRFDFVPDRSQEVPGGSRRRTIIYGKLCIWICGRVCICCIILFLRLRQTVFERCSLFTTHLGGGHKPDIHMCMYICTHKYIYMYVYIYVSVGRSGGWRTAD